MNSWKFLWCHRGQHSLLYLDPYRELLIVLLRDVQQLRSVKSCKYPTGILQLSYPQAWANSATLYKHRSELIIIFIMLHCNLKEHKYSTALSRFSDRRERHSQPSTFPEVFPRWQFLDQELSQWNISPRLYMKNLGAGFLPRPCPHRKRESHISDLHSLLHSSGLLVITKRRPMNSAPLSYQLHLKYTLPAYALNMH